MKKFIILRCLSGTRLLSQSFAQVQAQTQVNNPFFSPVLTDYYGIKGCLYAQRRRQNGSRQAGEDAKGQQRGRSI